MTKLRCIAIDDEPLALEILAEDISKIEFLDLKQTFLSAIDAQEYLKESSIDLIFSDIRMPTLSGIQFLRSLSAPPMLIFTTAYEQFAIEGFELKVVDYLLKPFSYERLKNASERALELFLLRKGKEEVSERKHFFIFAEYKKIKIYEDEILYIEGLKDYVKIFLKEQRKPILTRLYLKKMESQLSESKFCRVHQSYIVALDKISSTQKNSVRIGTIEINIGEIYADVFQKKYFIK